MITIREATETDIPAIHGLVAKLADYVNENQQFTTTIEQYRKDFDDRFFRALLAEHEGKVVGMTLYYFTYSTWKGRMIYLEDFVIKPDYRRQGIGQQLWDALQEVGRAKNCQLLKWQVVETNTAAIKFYEAQDAIIERDWYNGKLFL